MKSPSRQTILNEIFFYFVLMVKRSPLEKESMNQSKERAEIMIQLLEVCDYNNDGKFDKRGYPPNECKYELYDRFLGVLNRYNSKVESVAGLNTIKVCDYFNKIKTSNGANIV
jgi:hypothetical protein